MKLISTLRYSADKASPSTTGNYGGELRLFFSMLNKADYITTPPPVLWQGHGKGALDTYTLPSGDIIALNLDLVTQQIPGQIYIYGDIAVTTAAGVVFFRQPIGQSDKAIVPGKPVLSMLKGRSQWQNGSISLETGFELAVPWDGVSADCHGSWWVEWH